MRINERITALCRSVEKGASAADIGTDHGYVPLLLYRDGVSPFVIMCDISGDSLAKARESFELSGIDVPDDWFRVGNGLEPLDKGEVDSVIIAGLGGNTIIDILSGDPAKAESFRRLILQPRNRSGELRHYLYTHGFDIVCEELVAEGKFICEIITAAPSEVAERPEPYGSGDIRWLYPEAFAECDRELLERRLSWKFSSIARELESLSLSREDQSEKAEELMRERAYLEELKNR